MPAGAGPIVVANVRLDRVEVAMSRRTQLQIDLGRRRGLAKNELVATCQLQADRTPDMARETCDQRFQLHDLAAEAAPDRHRNDPHPAWIQPERGRHPVS